MECATYIGNFRAALRGHLPKARQKWLVYLVRVFGEIRGRTRLIKLLFLLKEKYGVVSDSYTFFAHRFGPYSHEVLDDIIELRTRSLLSEHNVTNKSHVDGKTREVEEFIYRLTAIGDQAAKRISLKLPTTVKDKFVALREDFGKKDLKELLEYVYYNYPEYAAESEIKGEVVRKKALNFNDFLDDKLMSA